MTETSEVTDQTGGEIRCLYVDDRAEFAAVESVVSEEAADITVSGEQTRGGARERLAEDSFDCVIVELKFATAVADTLEETPLVLFTETDSTAISDELLDAADTLVQKGERAHVAFLLDKIRGIVRDERTTESPNRVDRDLADARTAFFMLDGDGHVEWAKTPLEEVFPDVVGETERTATIHERLAAASTGEYGYAEQLATAVVNEASVERVGLALPRDSPPSESDTAVYTCWSYPVDGGQRRIEAYRDITAQLSQANRLSRLEELVELARDGLYMIDADARYTYVTERYAEMLGYERSELLGRHASAVMSEGALEEGQKKIGKLLTDSDRDSVVVDQPHLHSDGHEIALSIHCTVLTDDNGSYDGLMGVARDITERRERERELTEYKTVFETVHDRVYVLDDEGQIRLANSEFADMLSTSRSVVEGIHASEVFGQQGYERIRTAIDDLETTETSQGYAEFTLEAADSEIPCETSLSPLPGENHEGGWVGVVRDISDRVHREQQVAVMDRVLRHNLRNDLTAVLGRVDLLETSLEDDEAVEMMRTIRNRCNRLLEFAEKARRAQHVLDTASSSASDIHLSTALERVTDRIQFEYPGAVVSIDRPDGFDPMLPETVAIAVRNLVENAVEHTDQEPWVLVSVASESDSVSITVADDGPGLPEDEAEVLLHGTETPLKHGSGLGLWLVHWTVAQLAGSISIQDREPRGTGVTLSIPI